MSDLLIKGMKMPTCCSNCEFHECGSPDWCNLLVCDCREIDNSKIIQEWCPLAEVPTPHGRLIDADKLFKVLQEMAKDVDKDFASFSKDEELGIRRGLVIASQYLARFSDTVIEAEE